MGSKYPPGFYDDEAVTALTQAFREVWTTIMTDDPSKARVRDEQLRQAIVQTMMELAAEGVVNVDELRDRTLAKVITLHARP
jgi:hypothetical protein